MTTVDHIKQAIEQNTKLFIGELHRLQTLNRSQELIIKELKKRVYELEHEPHAALQFFSKGGDKQDWYHVVTVCEMAGDGFGPYVQSLWVTKRCASDINLSIDEHARHKAIKRHLEEWEERRKMKDKDKESTP